MFAGLTLISLALAAKLGNSIGRWALLVAPPAVAIPFYDAFHRDYNE
jgi:hypothetical protein